MPEKSPESAGPGPVSLPEEPRVVYESSMEALYVRALRPLMSEACLRELAAAGLDLSAPLRPQYLAEDTDRFLRIARAHLFPGFRDEEAYLRIGRLFLQGYFEIPLGAAVRSLLRLLGPERNVLRMPAYFEGGASYLKASVQKLAPGHFHLTVSEVAVHPAVTQGILEQAMKVAGARDSTVEYRMLPDGQVVYWIRWN